MKKPIKLLLILWCFVLYCSVIAYSASPYIRYLDIESGTKTGGKDNKGAFVRIFGKHFGSTQGSSSVSVNGGTVDNYPVWSDTEIAVQLGDSPTTGNLIVSHETNGNSNSVTFTIRSCDIYFVATTGDDNTGAGTYALPWRHLSKARDNMRGGDICYIRGGTYSEAGENSSGHIFYVSGSYPWGEAGSDGNPHCMLGYPGETVTLQTGSDASIINYANDNSSIVMTSNIVIANIVFDSNGWESGLGWRGCANGASTVNRVKNIRFVNIECKNYEFNSESGGNGYIEFGADGPLDNIKVIGCTVHDMDTDVGLDHGIYVSAGGDDIEFSYNTIYSIKPDTSSGNDGYAGFGIQVYAGSSGNYDEATNVVIKNNKIYDCTGRGGMNIADRAETTQIYNNIIYDCATDSTYQGWGLRVTWNGSGGTHYIYNNTFYNCGYPTGAESSLVSFYDCIHIYFRNNIMYAVNSNQDYYYEEITEATELTSTNNCWYNAGNAPAWDTNSVNSDPTFTDLNGDDYHILTGSPCKDTGYNTSSIVPRDYDSVSRPQNDIVDIGAYEYDIGGNGNGSGDVYRGMTIRGCTLR